MNSILILGGGINGAALAREFLLQGQPVCLVEAADLASGATAYSSRLVHGGLRYLEYGDFGLVRESLAERSRLLQLAPQFVRPLRLFIPLASRWGGWQPSMRRFLGLRTSATGNVPRGLWLVGTGLWMYDRLARDPRFPARQLFVHGDPETPAIDPRYRWLYAYFDAQMVSPERFVLALLDDARTLAAERGVHFEVFPYHRPVRCGDTVEITCNQSGAVTKTVTPDVIVNASGAWVDRTLRELQVEERRLMGGTKGSHFLTYHAELRALLGGSGIYVEADDGRPVFLLPWQEGTLVGTTDVPFEGDPAAAHATAEEIDYLRRAVHHVFPDIQLEADDVVMHYAGVRPLPYSDATTTGAITRRHGLHAHEGAVPLYSVVGGKLTTCRSLAANAARTILDRLGRPCQVDSASRPITGRCLGDPSLASSSQADLVVDSPFSRECVREVIRHEWVTRLEDLVERRLMLLYHQTLSLRCLRDLAALLVQEGRLAERDREQEVQACRRRLRGHFRRTVNDEPTGIE